MVKGLGMGPLPLDILVGEVARWVLPGMVQYVASKGPTLVTLPRSGAKRAGCWLHSMVAR